MNAAGGPADSMRSAWAVMSQDGRVIARGNAPLGASACDPAERRAASFAAEVPPGDYRVDVSVEDGHGHRAVIRSSPHVAAPASGLVLSDLVLSCEPAPSGTTDAVRFEPNLEGRVNRARKLTLYFEIDGLTTDPEGTSRFEYRYAVRPAGEKEARKRRLEPEIEATRQEQNVGRLRRQYLSIPLAGARSGPHEITIEIRDLASNGSAVATTRFTID